MFPLQRQEQIENICVNNDASGGAAASAGRGMRSRATAGVTRFPTTGRVAGATARVLSDAHDIVAGLGDGGGNDSLVDRGLDLDLALGRVDVDGRSGCHLPHRLLDGGNAVAAVDAFNL